MLGRWRCMSARIGREGIEAKGRRYKASSGKEATVWGGEVASAASHLVVTGGARGASKRPAVLKLPRSGVREKKLGYVKKSWAPDVS